MSTDAVIRRWHEFVSSGDARILDELLAEDVVFFSPVVFTPQQGREITKRYLLAAMQVFSRGTFSYQRELIDHPHAMLEFLAVEGKIQINGIDLITCNENGQITEFKVMVRPLQAINALHIAMGELLGQS